MLCSMMLVCVLSVIICLMSGSSLMFVLVILSLWLLW